MPTDVVSLQGRSILVCDVDETILEMLTDVFSEEGSTVTQAHGGQATLDALRTGRFDLVIQALVLPDVDGWDVLSFVRSRRPEMLDRLVLMTGYTYDPYTIRRIESLNLSALYKPFDLDELKNVVHNALYAAERTQRRSAA